MKDYYYILGLKNSATTEQVKQAYRKLSLKFHPDHNNGDKFFEERFRDINEAYETLTNEEKRKAYDAAFAAQQPGSNTGGQSTAGRQPGSNGNNRQQPVRGNSILRIVGSLFIVLVVVLVVQKLVSSKKTQGVKENDKIIIEKKATDAGVQASSQPPPMVTTVNPTQNQLPQSPYSKMLRTTRIRYCEFDTLTQGWTAWSNEWKDMDVVHTFTQHDSIGLVFGVQFRLDQTNSFARYRFEGYDAVNNWFKYVADNNDVICTKGVQLSYLATKGWPDFPVEIYYWSLKDRIALLFG